MLTRFAKPLTLLGFMILGSLSLSAHAYAPEGDLMKIKGYSPEVIQTTEVQRSRQEWRQPTAPTRNPLEKFFHNVYYGKWTGDMDDFGSSVIREN